MATIWCPYLARPLTKQSSSTRSDIGLLEILFSNRLVFPAQKGPVGSNAIQPTAVHLVELQGYQNSRGTKIAKLRTQVDQFSGLRVTGYKICHYKFKHVKIWYSPSLQYSFLRYFQVGVRTNLHTLLKASSRIGILASEKSRIKIK